MIDSKYIKISDWFRPIGQDLYVIHCTVQLKYNEVLQNKELGEQNTIGYYSISTIDGGDWENQTQLQLNNLKTIKTRKAIKHIQMLLKEARESKLFPVRKVYAQIHSSFDGCEDERVWNEDFTELRYICNHKEYDPETWYITHKDADSANNQYKKLHNVIKESEDKFYLYGTDIIIYNFVNERWDKINEVG